MTSQAEIDEALALHAQWLQNQNSGRFSLKNLSRADLSESNLYGANLSESNLSESNLSGADLSGADLFESYLYGANLIRTDLSGANLTRANLTRADLTRADLSGANLTWANLSESNLSGANLYGANLSGANLYGADLSRARLPHFQSCPEEGVFTAFKKLHGDVIATLRIPDTARRTSSLVGRKCRAEYAYVVAMHDKDGSPVESAVDMHTRKVEYRPTHIVRPDSYDDDIRVECTHGIHFFMTRREAEEY